MLFRLQLPRRFYEEMVAHARSAFPNECCGLLAGVRSQESGARSQEGETPIGHVSRHYPLLNELASPTEYISEPKSHVAADKDMRKEGLELLAIYHSHPSSDPVPSRKDIERNYYGNEVVHFIISLKDQEPLMRGWHLSETSYCEAEWEWTE
jgi:[CysO sulfur-carrier protein]-S-L-cysteine hydrolase